MSYPKKAYCLQKGFTLLEIILVIALIGGIAGVIIPNLRASIDSQMSVAIRRFSEQMRASYDDTILTARYHRMVIDIRSGEFWVEIAPMNYSGRPPLNDVGNSSENHKRDELKTFEMSLSDEAKNATRESPLSTENNKVMYSIRSIPVVQRSALRTIEWKVVNDSVLYKQALPKNIVFAKILSSLTSQALDYMNAMADTDKNKKYYGYVYFLPDGSTTGSSIQLAITDDKDMIIEKGLKYTLNLNVLTGQINLLEGFQDANFSPLKR